MLKGKIFENQRSGRICMSLGFRKWAALGMGYKKHSIGGKVGALLSVMFQRFVKVDYSRSVSLFG